MTDYQCVKEGKHFFYKGKYLMVSFKWLNRI